MSGQMTKEEMEALGFKEECNCMEWEHIAGVCQACGKDNNAVIHPVDEES